MFPDLTKLSCWGFLGRVLGRSLFEEMFQSLHDDSVCWALLVYTTLSHHHDLIFMVTAVFERSNWKLFFVRKSYSMEFWLCLLVNLHSREIFDVFQDSAKNWWIQPDLSNFAWWFSLLSFMCLCQFWWPWPIFKVTKEFEDKTESCIFKFKFYLSEHLLFVCFKMYYCNKFFGSS